MYCFLCLICTGAIQLATATTSVERQHYCPVRTEQEEPGSVYFTKTPATLRYACIKTYVELYCCVGNAASLEWFIRPPPDVPATPDAWDKFGIYTEDMYYMEQNQSAVIRQARYATALKCVARDSSGNQIENIVKLEVPKCEMPEKQKAFLPRDPVKTTPPVEDLAISCLVFFGRTSGKWNKVYWIDVNNTEEVKYPGIQHCRNDTHLKLCTTRTRSKGLADNSTVEVVLHIRDVTEDDSGRQFKCWSIGETNDAISKTVTVQVKVPATPWKNAMIGVAIVILVVIFGVAMTRRFKLELALYWKDRPTCRFRGASDDEMEYDAMPIYNTNSDEDRRFITQHMKNKLEKECGYKLCILDRDFMPGEPHAENFFTHINRSRLIIFILSPRFFECEWCEYVFLSSVPDRYRNMVFVEYAPVPPALWTKQRECLQAAVRVGRLVKWPSNQEGCGGQKGKVARFWKSIQILLPPLPKSSSHSDSGDVLLRTTNTHIAEDNTV